MNYKSRIARELLPSGYGHPGITNSQQKTREGYSGTDAPPSEYKIEKGEKPKKADTDTTAYDKAMEAIDDIIADQEQAEQYVQLSGQ